MKLRPAQDRILKYSGGRVAVNAVPGSGKTFTLSLLVAELLLQGRVNVGVGQQVLVVTYLNSSVDAFRAGIRQRLDELKMPELGFDVRTLHSLSLEIVREAESGSSSADEEIIVADESLADRILAQAIDGWMTFNPTYLETYLPENTTRMRVRWRNMAEKMARDFIRKAKNLRFSPPDIQHKLTNNNPYQKQHGGLTAMGDEPDHSLLLMLSDIYHRYQSILDRLNTIDFDDIIWRAVDLLENRSDVSQLLRQRWPYILEDEAQDSVPLQEQLLDALTGPKGNWVRVGDPNQSITSTFTAADPRHLTSFIRRPDVTSLPLPNSGRSAPRIYLLANALIDWVINHHPVAEVQQYTFLKQDILPTPVGDSQPNPPDAGSSIKIKVFKHRDEEELPVVAKVATNLTQTRPELSVAILAPTNAIGKKIGGHLDQLGADYDDMLRGGGKVREVASVLYAVVSLLANPLNTTSLEAVYATLPDNNDPAAFGNHDSKKISALLKSVIKPELFLFPSHEQDWGSALPKGVASDDDVRYLELFSVFLRRLFKYRPLAIDDMLLSLSDILFSPSGSSSDLSNELELAVAYQITNEMRLRSESQTDWRLPELAVELGDLAKGRSKLLRVSPKESGYKPVPGRITLATQHGAKGMEWDAVFLVGIDEFWIPGDLESRFQGVYEFLGGDPSAEATAQLLELMEVEAGPYPGRSATEAAHIEIIGERLRLLYVGITRARSYLQISRSQYVRRGNSDIASKPATVMAALYQFSSQYEPGH